MKQIKFLIGFLLISLALTSCLKDECSTSTMVYSYDPIYMTKAEINAQKVTTELSRPIKNPGKVYYIGNTLFVSEIGEGVHIIDNTDKTNPVPIVFLQIPGNEDVSFKGNHLIADSYINILFVDLADITSPTVVSRIDDLREQYYPYDAQKEAYIVGYDMNPTTREIACNHPFFERPREYYIYDDFSVFSSVETTGGFNTIFNDGAFSNSQGGNPGVAGSLSSFAVVNDYFYFIDANDVNVYNIEDLSRPIFTDGFEVAWNIETLFPYQDKLFIGGQNGMYIYDNTDPSSPQFLSEFTHARACDPVFVDGTTAYVTLSEGNACSNFTNQLDVIDLEDIYQPKLIKSYPMYKPKGLSVYNNTLFLCDEKAGLKIYDTTDKQNISSNKLAAIQGNTMIEVIHISPTIVMAIGPDGIFQFDVEDPTNPQMLSQIEISK